MVFNPNAYNYSSDLSRIANSLGKAMFGSAADDAAIARAKLANAQAAGQTQKNEFLKQRNDAINTLSDPRGILASEALGALGMQLDANNNLTKILPPGSPAMSVAALPNQTSMSSADMLAQAGALPRAMLGDGTYNPDQFVKGITGLGQGRDERLARSMILDPATTEDALRRAAMILDQSQIVTERGQDIRSGDTQRGQNMRQTTAERGQDMRQDTAERGQDIRSGDTQRGQNMRQTTAERGQDMRQDTAERGQDMRQDTSERGQDMRQDTSERGQDMRQDTAERGQDMRSDSTKDSRKRPSAKDTNANYAAITDAVDNYDTIPQVVRGKLRSSLFANIDAAMKQDKSASYDAVYAKAVTEVLSAGVTEIDTAYGDDISDFGFPTYFYNQLQGRDANFITEVAKDLGYSQKQITALVNQLADG